MASWELNRNYPRPYLIPRNPAFLGYKPLWEPGANEVSGEWIVRVRRALGIRQCEFARQLGVAPTTLARWERGESEPALECRRFVNEFFTRAGSCNRAEAGREMYSRIGGDTA